MSDMLVNLLRLPSETEIIEKLKDENIIIRQPIAPEKTLIVNWIRENFPPNWADECEVTFASKPVSTYIAVQDGKLLGFGCYEATCRNFFGPTGVHPDFRGKGIGLALLLKCLLGLREMGYVYCIIGGAGPVDFYIKAVGAIALENPDQGIYEGLLKKSE